MLSDCAMRYLLAIYALSRGQHALRSVQIARELEVSRASVAKMLKVLGQEGLVAKEYYSNVCLTPKGAQIAGALYAQYPAAFAFLYPSSRLGRKGRQTGRHLQPVRVIGKKQALDDAVWRAGSGGTLRGAFFMPVFACKHLSPLWHKTLVFLAACSFGYSQNIQTLVKQYHNPCGKILFTKLKRRMNVCSG